MRAYAFLREDGTDYVSGLKWPVPRQGGHGDWLEPRSAVRACTAEQLLWWLDTALWSVELDGSISDSGRAVHAERGRLLERVAAWTPGVAAEVTQRCQSRLDRLAADAPPEQAGELAGYAADALRFADEAGDPARGAAVVAYVAAHVVAGANELAPGYADAFAAEQQRQTAWLRERLGL